MEHSDYHPERPLRGYSVLLAGFGAALTSLAASRRRFAPALGDVALLGLATYQVSRQFTRDRVTTPLRRPFVALEHNSASSAGHHEPPQERPKGEGLERAVGQLVTCPYCSGTWTSMVFVAGLIHAPGPTRVIASVFSVSAISDALNRSYDLLNKKRTLTATKTESIDHQIALQSHAQ